MWLVFMFYQEHEARLHDAGCPIRGADCVWGGERRAQLHARGATPPRVPFRGEPSGAAPRAARRSITAHTNVAARAGDGRGRAPARARDSGAVRAFVDVRG